MTVEQVAKRAFETAFRGAFHVTSRGARIIRFTWVTDELFTFDFVKADGTEWSAGPVSARVGLSEQVEAVAWTLTKKEKTNVEAQEN